MTKMYSERRGNISVFRSCFYSCTYCAFQKFQKISSCPKCRAGENHSHMEVLQRTPPKTKGSEFLTVGLSGDVSFMSKANFWQVLEYCRQWGDRTFLIQSKNPEYFLQFNHYYCSKISKSNIPAIPSNVILGTTIETNRFSLNNCVKYYDKDFHGTWKMLGRIPQLPYTAISKAPYPEKRYEAMLKLNCRKAVTIEPILDFDIKILEDWILTIQPEFVYIGYANDKKEGKRLKLPEPELQKTYALIDRLKRNCYGTEIRIKTLRKAWWE